MEKIDILGKPLQGLKEYMQNQPGKDIKSFIRFDGRYLLEDQTSGFDILNNDKLDSKTQGNLIFAVNRVYTEINRKREHKAGYKGNPWEIFHQQYGKQFTGIPRKTFNNFYEYTLGICLQPSTEFQLEDHLTDFVNLLKKSTGQQEDLLKMLDLFLTDPNAFFKILPSVLEDGVDKAEQLALIQMQALRIWKSSINLKVFGIDALCAAENNSEFNDYFVENHKVYYDFTCNLHQNDRENIVILPTIFFIKNWLLDERLNGIPVTFVLRSKHEISILKQKNIDKVHYILLKDLQDFVRQNSGLLDNGLLFCHHLPADFLLRDVMETVKDSHCSLKHFIIYGTDFEVTEGLPHIDSRYKIQSVSLLPPGINHETKPGRKTIISLELPNSTEQNTEVLQYQLSTCRGYQYLLRKPLVLLLRENEIPSNWDFRGLYRKEERDNEKKTNKERAKAEVIPFTEEISFHVVVSDDKPGKKRVKAYIVDPVSGAGIVKQTLKSVKGIDQGKVQNWINQVYPYETVKCSGNEISVRKEIAKFYEKSLEGNRISLKTFVYLCPECDEIFGKDLLEMRRLLEGPLGAVLIDAADDEIVDRLLNNDAEKFDDLRRVYNEKTEISAVLDLAVEKEWMPENVLKETVAQQSNDNRAYYEVRNALVKRHLDLSQMRAVYQAARKKSSNGDNRYFALLIRLMTGLETSSVVALKWSDVHVVSGYDGHPFCQLFIRRRASFDGKSFIKLGKKEAYRCIPCSEELSKMLLLEREKQKEEAGANAYSQLDNLAVVSGGAHVINGETAIYSPSQINEITRRLLKRYMTNQELITLPKSEKEVREIDLQSYNGDLFRSNYRHHCLKECAFEKAEVDYLIGNAPDFTFARNYCDFGNEMAQYLLKVKQDRFAALLTKQKDLPARIFESNDGNFISEQNLSGKTELSFSLNGNATLYVDSEHGVDVEIRKIGRKKK